MVSTTNGLLPCPREQRRGLVGSGASYLEFDFADDLPLRSRTSLRCHISSRELSASRRCTSENIGSGSIGLGQSLSFRLTAIRPTDAQEEWMARVL